MEKADYFFGRASGSLRNVERSVAQERQLNRIGIFDNKVGRDAPAAHLTGVFDDARSVVRVNGDGMLVRDGLLAGPRGLLKSETIWDGNRIITGFLFGGN